MNVVKNKRPRGKAAWAHAAVVDDDQKARPRNHLSLVTTPVTPDSARSVSITQSIPLERVNRAIDTPAGPLMRFDVTPIRLGQRHRAGTPISDTPEGPLSTPSALPLSSAASATVKSPFDDAGGQPCVRILGRSDVCVDRLLLVGTPVAVVRRPRVVLELGDRRLAAGHRGP